MPYRNRVTPTGEIIVTSARGLFMGNRGVLHNGQGELVRTHQGTRWIVCLLDFKGRRRQVMTPGRYTELFFLDEATALAAGHRPCKECRPADFQRFATLWRAVNGGAAKAGDMDAQLHQERTATQKTRYPSAGSLPDGTFVESEDGEALLVWRASLWLWTPAGYTERFPLTRPGPFTLLTPPSILRVLAGGYSPGVHPTACSIGEK